MPDRDFHDTPSPGKEPGTGRDTERSSTNRSTERSSTDRNTNLSTERGTEQERDAERRRRRAQFLRDLAEARALRDRVQPRRAKVARLRHAMRMRTFRW
ncbi:hypothetical protein [Streptomyces sp. NPDC057363]|uniref:hypothetical protein n=1 Tax=Streptomyces sp. NPDC057363 TaxID=3346107 RepID=UPI0036391485